MKLIKIVSKEIETNLCEADEKIEAAYRIKAQNSMIAAWYKDMASAHCNFNSKGHEIISQLISSYKDSKEYKDHPEYTDGMMAIWNDKHAELSSKAARVRSLIENFK